MEANWASRTTMRVSPQTGPTNRVLRIWEGLHFIVGPPRSIHSFVRSLGRNFTPFLDADQRTTTPRTTGMRWYRLRRPPKRLFHAFAI